jgi:hypothetical protein
MGSGSENEQLTFCENFFFTDHQGRSQKLGCGWVAEILVGLRMGCAFKHTFNVQN